MFSNSQNLRLYVKNIKLEARHATDMDYIHIMRSSGMSYIYIPFWGHAHYIASD